MRAIWATLRQAWASISKKVTRAVVLRPLFFLPQDKKIRLERWLRGREQFSKLRRADIIVVSFGKSGRTWLRVMLSRFYQLRHGLPERALIGFDNFHLRKPAIPKIFFTHDNYVKDYTGNDDNKADYYGKKVVLLVRHPADVAVSQYHQWRFRMRPKKKALNDYPEHGRDVDMFDFVAHERAGLEKAIEFLNAWADEFPHLEDLIVVRYEDLKNDTEATLSRLLDFMGENPRADEVADAVRFASFENMRQLETGNTFWLSGGRMVAKDKDNPKSFKTRRGKAGGYREDFNADQLAEIDEIVSLRLSPSIGYTEGEEAEADTERTAVAGA